MLYYWHMKNWDTLQQAALGSHGIVTFAQAKEMGIFPAELYRWCRKGLLMKTGRGVFRMTAYPSQGLVSDMAALLAMFGDDAYLVGVVPASVFHTAQEQFLSVGAPDDPLRGLLFILR